MPPSLARRLPSILARPQPFEHNTGLLHGYLFIPAINTTEHLDAIAVRGLPQPQFRQHLLKQNFPLEDELVG